MDLEMALASFTSVTDGPTQTMDLASGNVLHYHRCHKEPFITQSQGLMTETLFLRHDGGE